MKKWIIHIVFLFIAFTVDAQVYLEESIQLTGTDNANRQVENLSSPVKKDQAVAAEAYMQNHLLYSTAFGSNDSLTLAFPITFTDYSIGMTFYMQMPQTNSGALMIKTGSLPYKEIKLDHRSLDSGEVTQSRIIQVIYNGHFFELLSDPDRPCPSGFTAVTKDYCIETIEQDSLIFHNAIEYCMSNGSRLCSWSEWFYACNKAGTLGLPDMIGNLEWIDDAGNYLSDMTVRASGGTACNHSVSEYSGFNRAFRCCYSR